MEKLYSVALIEQCIIVAHCHAKAGLFALKTYQTCCVASLRLHPSRFGCQIVECGKLRHKLREMLLGVFFFNVAPHILLLLQKIIPLIDLAY